MWVNPIPMRMPTAIIVTITGIMTAISTVTIPRFLRVLRLEAIERFLRNRWSLSASRIKPSLQFNSVATLLRIRSSLRSMLDILVLLIKMKITLNPLNPVFLID